MRTMIASILIAEGCRGEERHEFTSHVDPQTTGHGVGIAQIKGSTG
jgi:hypothetical protein